MDKTEKIKKLAQGCLDEKWNNRDGDLWSCCPFCEDTTNKESMYSMHDCTKCIIDKIVCNAGGDDDQSLLGYFSEVYFEDEDGNLPISRLSDEDYTLIINALKEMVKDGKISKSTRKSIKKKIKLIEL